MSMAIAYEAAGQPVAGQEAVGQVILNRLRDPRFPKTVCGVVYQGSERMTGCQFTFTCDGSFRRRLADTTLVTARSIAETVMNGAAPDRVAGATHYHADYVLPYWAASGLRVARIGAHIFYRMPGNGLPAVEAAKLTRTEPAAPRAVFAPWGLPVYGAAQR
jgi:spore germination cell wall hydrolase CwlJ-like protein